MTFVWGHANSQHMEGGGQFSVSTMGPEHQPWVVRLGSKCLSPPSPLGCPLVPLLMVFISTDVSKGEHKAPPQEPQKQPAPETRQDKSLGNTVAAGPAVSTGCS